MVAEALRSQDRRRSLVSAAVAVAVHGLAALVAMTAAERAPAAPARQPLRPLSVRVQSQPRPRPPAGVAPSQPAPVPAAAQPAAPKAPPSEVTRIRPSRAQRPRAAKAVLPAVLVAKAVDGGAETPEIVQGSGDMRQGDAGLPGGGEDGDVPEVPANAPPSAPAPPPPEPPQAAEPPEELQPPEPIERPFGRFPAGVVRPDAPVRVVVALDVTAGGAVSAARVARGAGEPFDGEALVVARSLQFRPARRGGRPVALTVPWVVTFR